MNRPKGKPISLNDEHRSTSLSQSHRQPLLFDAKYHDAKYPLTGKKRFPMLLTFLLVEHNLKVDLSLADHVYSMGKAHIGFGGTRQELEAQPDIKRKYLEAWVTIRRKKVR